MTTMQQMSNDEVMATLHEAVRNEGSLTARVVALLIEVENRRIHLERGYPNIFVFCRVHLGYSEDESYRRMESARLARQFPQVLEALRERRIHMTAALLLRSVLTDENVEALLIAASGKTKSEVQLIVAELAPKPDVQSSIREYPAPRKPTLASPESIVSASPEHDVTAPASASRAASPLLDRSPVSNESSPQTVHAIVAAARIEAPRIRPADQIEPLSATRHRVQFTVTTEQRRKLERARQLTRHANIEGDLAIILEQAVDLLIAKREKEKLAAAGKPRTKAPLGAADERGRIESQVVASSESSTPTPTASSKSRSAAAAKPTTISAATKREVIRRDGEHCSFVAPTGERCPARELLEVDHRHPRALGGSDEVSNLRLLCRGHNHFEAEQAFGREHVSRAIAKRREKKAVSGRAEGIAPSASPESTSDLSRSQGALPFA